MFSSCLIATTFTNKWGWNGRFRESPMIGDAAEAKCQHKVIKIVFLNFKVHQTRRRENHGCNLFLWININEILTWRLVKMFLIFQAKSSVNRPKRKLIRTLVLVRLIHAGAGSGFTAQLFSSQCYRNWNLWMSHHGAHPTFAIQAGSKPRCDVIKLAVISWHNHVSCPCGTWKSYH